MKSVTVYTKNACVNCESTKAALADLGVEYNLINLSNEPEQLEKLISLGFRAAPVVVTATDAWAGHKPEKIAAAFAA